MFSTIFTDSKLVKTSEVKVGSHFKELEQVLFLNDYYILKGEIRYKVFTAKDNTMIYKSPYYFGSFFTDNDNTFYRYRFDGITSNQIIDNKIHVKPIPFCPMWSNHDIFLCMNRDIDLRSKQDNRCLQYISGVGSWNCEGETPGLNVIYDGNLIEILWYQENSQRMETIAQLDTPYRSPDMKFDYDSTRYCLICGDAVYDTRFMKTPLKTFPDCIMKKLYKGHVLFEHEDKLCNVTYVNLESPYNCMGLSNTCMTTYNDHLEVFSIHDRVTTRSIYVCSC